MDKEKEIIQIRTRVSRYTSRSYLSPYKYLITYGDRNIKRKIDIPDPAYRDAGLPELLELTNRVLEINDGKLLFDYLASLQVDYDFYMEMDYNFPPIQTARQTARQARRIFTEINRVAAHIANSAESNSVYYNQIQSNVEIKLNSLYDQLIQSIVKNPHSIYSITPRQFEELIAELLVYNGWEVELTPETRDGGYDLFAISKPDELTGVKSSFVIECKRYSIERKVGISTVRQLLHVKDRITASNAMIITSSDFTKGVYDYKAERYDFDAKNFESVINWCNRYKSL
jgi:HJR/Mrr/RecB family endonuclease